MDRERKRRTNRMLIAMVTVFGVSWLPLNTVNLVNDVNESTGDWPYYNLSFFMVHAIAMSSTCYNPFLYAWLNENFRKEFKQVSFMFPTNIKFSPRENVCALVSYFSLQLGSWMKPGWDEACLLIKQMHIL